MTTEKFFLKWTDFQYNISNAYQELGSNLDFSDLTLVCEDDQHFEAHRIILSACSPFFSKHSHPMIYMKGLNANELGAIVDLQLKGLARSENSNTDGAEESLLMPHGIKKEKTIYEPRKPFENPMTISDGNIAKCSNGKPVPEDSQIRGIGLILG